MLEILLTTVFLVAATVAIHAYGTTRWIRFMVRRYAGPDGDFKAHTTLPAVTWTAVVLLMLHLVEIVLWAVAYLLILPGDQLKTLEEATYFSAVTFTTLGYGDISLAEHGWRLLSGMEALNGILLVGWSTALFFGVVQRSWKSMAHGHGGT